MSLSVVNLRDSSLIRLAFALCAAAMLAVAGAPVARMADSVSISGSSSSPSAPPAVVGDKIDAIDAIDKIDPALLGAGGTAAVIVSTTGTTDAAAEVTAAVAALGGTVGEPLPLVNGFEATVPADALDALAALRSVRSISANASVAFEELTYDEASTASNFVRTADAAAAWEAGHLGEGVGVAVIDTGVSSMKDFEGRLVFGPDLSGEGTTVDTYGHGTVMAGIIGGSGADSATRDGGAFTGVAPKSWIVAVKAAGRNGSTDVSTVLQAMHWVSAYADQFNIRVLNLSWGTPSTQSPDLDPVNYAVQRLWQQGIVVVAAAGNSGPSTGTITKPADDPIVLSVGGFNDNQNLDVADDDVPAWSSRGPTATGLSKPDLVAPGRLIVASRSYGSEIAATYPKAAVEPSYIRGSGTSQAAAVTSGAAALLLGARPELTPDQVKAVLTGTASPIAGVAADMQGAGRLQLGAALAAEPGPATWQTPTATGMGSIEKSRGGFNVETDCGNDGTIDVIVGEIDVRCEAWDPEAWTGNAWTGNAWTGNAWTGNAWTGNAWTGNAWTGATWTGNAWTGGTWTGNAWTGNAWTGNAWTGNAWTGNAWTGSTWTGTTWTGNAWTGNAWTGSTYDGDDTVWATAFFGRYPLRSNPVAGERFEPVSVVAGSMRLH